MRSQNPWAWAGLAALALPVLIHLFSRRQARTAAFPTLRFLDVSRLLPTRRTQISDVALLLVRLAVLLFAVAALAQPLFNVAHTPSASLIARAVIVDTTDLAADSTALAALRAQTAALTSGASSAVAIEGNSPRMLLDGARTWLTSQPGLAEVIVLSAFAPNALDSLDLAALPADVNVRLVRRTASGTASASLLRGRVQWSHRAADSSASAATLQAVRALGGTAVTDSTLGDAPQVIVVASPAADSLATWLRTAHALDAAWMGDVLSRLHRDTTLVTSSASLASLPDTLIGDPLIVVTRSNSGAPVVAAAAIAAGGGKSHLLLVSRAPADHLATAALLLSASQALTPARTADSSRVTDEQLRHWEHAPAASSIAARIGTVGDYDTGPSDARYFWLVVLALLGVETWLRRRISSAAANAETAVGAS